GAPPPRGDTAHTAVHRGRSAPATGRSPRAGRASAASPEPGGRRRRSGLLRPEARRGTRRRTALAWPPPLFHRHVTRETSAGSGYEPAVDRMSARKGAASARSEETTAEH